jgi:ACR3 family arsenite efflux pump ArsB
MERYWFKRKLFGWGWYPSTWQGWSILGFYLLLVVLAAYNASLLTSSSSDNLFFFIPEVVFYTLILLLITFRTGESPKWQWERKRK